MKKITHPIFTALILLTFGLILCATQTAQAQWMYDVQDSFYFMQDDGEFSDEEKDLEAQYVFRMCSQNTIQSTYFDCACLAGAFRQERDKPDLVPQDTLVNNILTNESRGCANTAAIAGDTYEFCSAYAKIFRARKNDGPEYCKCVANRSANAFKKKPTFAKNNIEKIRTNALLSCDRNPN